MVNDTDPFVPDRRQGFLNERYRRYLMGTGDIDPYTQQERDIRSSIRRRLYHAILDFAVVQQCIQPRDLDMVADQLAVGDDLADHSVMRAPGGVHRGVIAGLTVLGRVHPDLEAFEGSVAEASARVLRAERDGSWSADVDIDAERTKSASEIIDHLDAGEYDSLNGPEAKWALRQLDDNEEGGVDLSAMQEEEGSSQ